jgi:hypothetical protein
VLSVNREIPLNHVPEKWAKPSAITPGKQGKTALVIILKQGKTGST